VRLALHSRPGRAVQLRCLVRVRTVFAARPRIVRFWGHLNPGAPLYVVFYQKKFAFRTVTFAAKRFVCFTRMRTSRRATPRSAGPSGRAKHRHDLARQQWSPSNLPAWLNEEFCLQRIEPHLKTIKVREISQALRISKPYAALIRAGRRRPHPRHWQALAELVGVSGKGEASHG
jgi:hypothetical protein